MESLLFPFQFSFMTNAFIMMAIIAVPTSLLSCCLVLKGWSLMGDAISHAVLPGIVLYKKISTDMHLDHILFGNMLGVSAQDLWTAGAIAAFVAVIVIAKRQDFMLHAFDPVQAQAVGLRVSWLHYGLLIAPGAIAFLLTKRFALMLPIAVGVTMVLGFVGVYLSFLIDSAPAPTVILVLTAIFIAAFIRANHKMRQTAVNVSDSVLNG